MAKHVVQVMTAKEALEMFTAAANLSDGARARAVQFASGDVPLLCENFVEVEHTCTLQIPYTLRKILANENQGIAGLLTQALKEGTQITSTANNSDQLPQTARMNPNGYICDVAISMGGMNGPMSLLFSMESLNQLNSLIMVTHHAKASERRSEIDHMLRETRANKTSQWLARATSISSYRNPKTGQLLSTDMLQRPSTTAETPASSSSSSSSSAAVDDDAEAALLAMQESMERMIVMDGIEFPERLYPFRGRDKLRHTYDVWGGVSTSTLSPTMFQMKRNDRHSFVLAHSVLGMSVLGRDITLTYRPPQQDKECTQLPEDVLGYMLRVPTNLLEEVHKEVVRRSTTWQTHACHNVNEMRIRLQAATPMAWRYDQDADTYTRGDFVVYADQPFTLSMRLHITMRHYHTESCAALLPHFKDVWPRPVMHVRDVNSKTGEVAKDARSLVHPLGERIAYSENQLQLLAQLTDEQVVEAMRKANVHVDEQGNIVEADEAAAASSSSTSEETTACDDD